MSKQQLVSEPIGEAEVADLDKIAAHWDCTREHVVATAVLRLISEELNYVPEVRAEWADLPPYVETDPLAIALHDAEQKAVEALRAYLKPAEDDIAAGRVLSHEEMMAELESGRLISQDEMESWFAERIRARKPAAAAE